MFINQTFLPAEAVRSGSKKNHLILEVKVCADTGGEGVGGMYGQEQAHTDIAAVSSWTMGN